ncbi:MAG TPA: prepilin-type N-terminal cleavage/methylation domain-containing protein [Oscillospiraceae bacterium]|nr:prepilin-type N-terminal cleavage/methylation domain-containing protein [Oscillospiraceae bacterium]
MKTKRAIPGFTLIELIIVLAIIAVLAAVAVPGIGGYIRDNRIEEANNNAQILARGAQTWLNEMEADNKPIDAYNNPAVVSTEANLFKSTSFGATDCITLASTNTIGTTDSYKFTATTAIPGSWVNRDGTGVSTPALSGVDLTKYLAGLKPAKSGTDLGSCFICIDLTTKTVRYAAWTADDDWTQATYLNGTYTHNITDRAKQEDLVTSNGNHIIGVYPMNDELL